MPGLPSWQWAGWGPCGADSPSWAKRSHRRGCLETTLVLGHAHSLFHADRVAGDFDENLHVCMSDGEGNQVAVGEGNQVVDGEDTPPVCQGFLTKGISQTVAGGG